jgi:hypothetical protein
VNVETATELADLSPKTLALLESISVTYAVALTLGDEVVSEWQNLEGVHYEGGALHAEDATWELVSFTADGALVAAPEGFVAVPFGDKFTATGGTFVIQWAHTGVFELVS